MFDAATFGFVECRLDLNSWVGLALNLRTIGDRVVARRKMLKLNQLYVAKTAGMSRATLSALENGKTNVGLLQFLCVLEVLQMNLEVKCMLAPEDNR